MTIIRPRGFTVGVLYILASSLLFGTYGIWSKLMADDFPPFSQAWMRGLGIIVVLIPLMVIRKQYLPVHPQDWKWFAMVSIPGSLVLAFYYYAFQHLAIGTATLVFFSSLTLGTFVIGYVFFGETLTRLKWGALGLGILGLYWVSCASLTTLTWLPLLAGIGAGLCGAMEVVFTKKLSHRYCALQISIYLFVTTVILNVLLAFGLGESMIGFAGNARAWIAQGFHTIATLMAFLCVVKGFQSVEPSVGGIIGLTEVVFGIGFGVIFFGEGLTMSLIGGAGCILLAAFLPAYPDMKRNFMQSQLSIDLFRK